jgi:hypothetical protein
MERLQALISDIGKPLSNVHTIKEGWGFNTISVRDEDSDAA